MPTRLSLAVTAAATFAIALVPSTSAHALVPQQVVTVGNMFVPGDITILQGDTLTLTNADLAVHNLIALDSGSSGPLFASANAGPGKQVAVNGVSALTPSVYPFYCSVHEFMTGTLTVVGL